jgi:hypothetical protein
MCHGRGTVQYANCRWTWLITVQAKSKIICSFLALAKQTNFGTQNNCQQHVVLKKLQLVFYIFMNLGLLDKFIVFFRKINGDYKINGSELSHFSALIGKLIWKGDICPKANNRDWSQKSYFFREPQFYYTKKTIVEQYKISIQIFMQKEKWHFIITNFGAIFLFAF